MTANWKRVSGSTLKLIGVATMCIDHIGLALVGRMMLAASPGAWLTLLRNVYSVTRSIGRLAFPIFCFLLAEGFEKTGSRPKYLFRMGIFALISEVPYDLAFCARLLEFGHQNVYFTLFLGLLSLCAFVYAEEHRLPAPVGWFMCAVGVAASGAWLTEHCWQLVQRYILSRMPGLAVFGRPITPSTLFWMICVSAAIFLVCCRVYAGTDKMLRVGTKLAILFLLMFLADLLHTDYSGVGVLTVTAIYILRNHSVPAMAGGCAVLMLKGLRELMAFWTLIPVAMYNGERGLKLKYFFYVFYPAHLLLLWFVAWLMGTASIPVF